jgi:hypothetical protein
LFFADDVDRLVGKGASDGNQAHLAPPLIRVLDQLADYERCERAGGIDEVAGDAD